MRSYLSKNFKLALIIFARQIPSLILLYYNTKIFLCQIKFSLGFLLNYSSNQRL